MKKTREEAKQDFKDVARKGRYVEEMVRTEGWKVVKKALEKEIDSLKFAYDCKSLRELDRMKSLYTGLNYTKKLVAQIIKDGVAARDTLNQWYEK